MLHRFLPVCLVAVCAVAFAVFLLSALGLSRAPESRRAAIAPAEDRSQCAHWCVHRCASVLGVPTTMPQLRKMIPVRDDGVSLLQIKDALSSLGLTCAAVRAQVEELTSADLPCIAHLKDPDHFIVLAGRSADAFYVFDNSNIRRNVLPEELSARWSGHVLRVQRADRPPTARRELGDRPAPRIQFETLHVDHLVKQDQRDVVYEFPFQNVGPQPLTILEVQPGCSCLHVERPPEPVPAGGKSAIKLVYRPQVAQNPEFGYSVVVKTDDPQNPVLELYAGGTVDLQILPGNVNLGDVILESPRTVRLTLWDGTRPEQKVVHAVTTTLFGTQLGWKEGSGDTDELLKEQGLRVSKCSACGPSRKVLDVTLFPKDEQPGEFTASILVFGEFGEDNHRVPIHLSGRFVPPVTLSRSSIYFDDVEPSVEYRASATVSVEPDVDQRFTLLGIAAPHGVSCAVEPTTIPAMARVDISGRGENLVQVSGKDIQIWVRMVDSRREYTLRLPVHAWSASAERDVPKALSANES